MKVSLIKWGMALFIAIVFGIIFALLYFTLYKIPELHDAFNRFFGGDGVLVSPSQALENIIKATIFMCVFWRVLLIPCSHKKEEDIK